MSGIKVAVLDPYYNPVPTAKIRASIGPEGRPAESAAELQEKPDGTYNGSLRLPARGTAVLLLEVTLPDGPYLAELPIEVGPKSEAIDRWGVGLLPQEVAALAATGSTPETASPLNQSGKSAPKSQPVADFLREALSIALPGVVLIGLYLLEARKRRER